MCGDIIFKYRFIIVNLFLKSPSCFLINDCSSMLSKFLIKNNSSMCSKSPFLCLDYHLIILFSFNFFNFARLYPFSLIPQENRLLETLKNMYGRITL